MSKTNRNNFFYIGFVSLAVLVLVFFVLPGFLPASFSFNIKSDLASTTLLSVATTSGPVVEKRVVTHVKTPEAVKGIYMTACVAGTPSFRAKLVKLIKETELNSLIIDIKDYTGTISFSIDKPLFRDNTGGGCRVVDMLDFIESLHRDNIYVIGRITAFQDPYITKIHPEWAIKKNSDRSIVWKDRKGISFADAGNREMWQYLADLARASYEAGFDELNFDYIRFPSDGDMKDIYFPSSNDVLVANATSSVSGKSKVLKSFFEFLHENFAPAGIPISADLFGMTTTNFDDLNIGQVLEDAAPNFDYIAPMVYPSHYPPGFLNYNSVSAINAHPYEIVKYSMDGAVRRLQALASSTPNIKIAELRPWLQDNDYPVPYTPAMVRAQIQATYDAGLTSWMLWDAGNTYTQSALLSE